MNVRLQQLLEQVEKQEGSPEIYREIADLIYADQTDELLPQFDALHQHAIQQPLTSTYHPEEWRAVINAILDVDKMKAEMFTEAPLRNLNAPRRMLTNRWWSAAAIFLIMLGAGIWWMQTHNWSHAPLNNKHVAVTDLKGLQYGAELTLSSGRVIQLDTASNGNLADDGGAIVRKVDDQIVYQGTVNEEAVYNNIQTHKGKQYHVTLPDGTKVWLNAASKLKYPTTFKKNREVELEGEAYFDVAPNEKQPFIVKVKDMEVKVLGTGFNINAYAEQPYIRTTLINGRVQTTSNTRSVLLEPGEQANVGNNHLFKLKVDVQLYTAWMRGAVYFESETFHRIAAHLERTYDCNFVFTNSDLTALRLTIELRKPKNLQEVLDAISLISDLRFTTTGNTVYVHDK